MRGNLIHTEISKMLFPTTECQNITMYSRTEIPDDNNAASNNGRQKMGKQE